MSEKATRIEDIFGAKVFSDPIMRQVLPPETYDGLRKARLEGCPLEKEHARIIALAMKDWALEQGATHFTHWFQPMTGVTAGKHDSFIAPAQEDGKVIMEFSEKSLIRGEPDASSFPSGGLRSTFEARGYTSWDCTSPAFIKGTTLYIPTAFCAYTGEALDTKTPLLRSTQAVSRQASRVLHLLGETNFTTVLPNVGAEQEYFLIDRSLYEKRLDLKICGTTLFGAKPSKGQQLDDHYCGRIRLRVEAFMQQLDRELWELGILAKTKHNETAPAQHELAPVFSTVNIACDHNQLIMETMRSVAKRMGFACLLHEKPFRYVNGSGKHNNWSLSTDTGKNLLSPGENPRENLVFLTFLSAIITAVDTYPELLRFASASAGNDDRLGGSEAPPAIISIFLGNQLTADIFAAASGSTCDCGHASHLETGVRTLPNFRLDDSDRNRTSPFAFTGNKFEFRMVGSSASIATINTVLNTAVADVLDAFAKRLENCSSVEDEVKAIVRDTLEKHQRIIFNGNNYSEEWVKEAEKRGLPNLRTSVESFESFILPKNLELFKRTGVLSESEIFSRYEIYLETYVKTTAIKASVMLEMANRQIIPACVKYTGQLSGDYNQMMEAGLCAAAVKDLLDRLSRGLQSIITATRQLEDVYAGLDGTCNDFSQKSVYCRDTLLPAMEHLRSYCDVVETLVSDTDWPMPNYTDLLHRV